MSAPIFFARHIYTHSHPDDCVSCATVAFDALTSITCLIFGILGLTAIVAMSPAVAYSLIGISCFITLAWIAIVIQRCCQ